MSGSAHLQHHDTSEQGVTVWDINSHLGFKMLDAETVINNPAVPAHPRIDYWIQVTGEHHETAGAPGSDDEEIDLGRLSERYSRTEQLNPRAFFDCWRFGWRGWRL